MFRGLRTISNKNFVCGWVSKARTVMVSGGDVSEMFEKRAVEAEETLSLLKAQLAVLQKATGKRTQSTGIKDPVSALKQENERLKQEAAQLKAELEYWEVRNGVKQVSLPTPAPASSTQAPLAVAIPEAKKDENTSTTEKAQKPTEKKKKTEKAGKKPKEAKEEKPSAGVDVSRIDFRVGKIMSVKKHPDADTLFVEEIDVGEESCRTVCSGLVGSVALEELQDRMVIAMCNLKPVKMRGITSQAMVMCSATDDRQLFEVLDPPDGCVPGDRVVFDGFPGEPDKQLNPKKKVWEQVQPLLRTSDSGVACYQGVPFTVPGKGVCTSRKLFNALIC